MALHSMSVAQPGSERPVDHRLDQRVRALEIGDGAALEGPHDVDPVGRPAVEFFCRRAHRNDGAIAAPERHD
jgi:hypothetical protein